MSRWLRAAGGGQLLDPLLQRRRIDQLVARGVGGHRCAVEGARGRGQFLRDRLLQNLPVEFIELWSKAVTERIPARTGWRQAAQQPPHWVRFVGVAVPDGWTVVAALGLVKDGLEQQVGRVGQRAPACVSGEQHVEVEPGHGLLDTAGKVITGQALLQFLVSRVVHGPRRHGKAAPVDGEKRGW